MSPITPAQLVIDIDDFLAFKRSLGHPYQRGEAMLRSFQRYVDAHTDAITTTFALETLLSGWLGRRSGCQSVTIATELGVLRQLCRYRQRTDPDSFVPGRDWAPQSTASHFLPHVFSLEEVRALIKAADTYPGRLITPATLRTLLLILYCTGLRLGEAVRLKQGDVVLQPGMFTVRESKSKMRLVPFQDDLARVLSDYLSTTRPASVAADPAAAAFLLNARGEGISVCTASDAIRRLLRSIGLKPLRGRCGPRPYDMRHTFAVHRLTQWYQQDVDIHARLPWLSAYMGHDNVLGTEVYLHATAELMGLASERFAARFHADGKPS